jgi:hypothetical protein
MAGIGEVIGLVSACMSIATTLLDTTERVKTLCESYQGAQESMTLIETRVTTINAALSQIQAWSNTPGAETSLNEGNEAALKGVVGSISTVLEAIVLSLTKVQDAWNPGLRYLWDETRLRGFGGDLSSQVLDLNLLVSTLVMYVFLSNLSRLLSLFLICS